MQTRAIVSQTNRGARLAAFPAKVFQTKMFSRSYEFRSAAVLEGSKTIGRQVNRTIGIKGKGVGGSRRRGMRPTVSTRCAKLT